MEELSRTWNDSMIYETFMKKTGSEEKVQGFE
jgi:hypothetical protein